MSTFKSKLTVLTYVNDTICCHLQNVPVTHWRNLCLIKQYFQIGFVHIQLCKLPKYNFANYKILQLLLMLSILRWMIIQIPSSSWSGYSYKKHVLHTLSQEEVGAVVLPRKLNPQGLRIHSPMEKTYEECFLHLTLTGEFWESLQGYTSVKRTDFVAGGTGSSSIFVLFLLERSR